MEGIFTLEDGYFHISNIKQSGTEAVAAARVWPSWNVVSAHRHGGLFSRTDIGVPFFLSGSCKGP